MYNQSTESHLKASKLNQLVGKKFRAATEIAQEGSIVDFDGNQIPALCQDRKIAQNDLIEVTQKITGVGVIVMPVSDNSDIIEMS